MATQTPALVKKLRQQLQLPTSPSWYELLHVHLLSSNFGDVIDILVEKSTEGYLPDRFTPPLKHIFRPFQLCPPDKLKVVILVPGPWPSLNQADGLALSSKSDRESGVIAPAELAALLEGVQHEFDLPKKGSYNLERWAEQGVLLLNRSLTIGIDKGEQSLRTHTKYWESFFNFVLEAVRKLHPTAPILYYGSCLSLAEDDPAWEHAYLCEVQSVGKFARLLTRINEDLEAQGQTPIIW